MSDQPLNLVESLLAGDRRALARLITLVENDASARGRQAADVLAAIYPHTGRARLIGVTGAPGTGKSSLVNRMALALRAQGRTVGIVAVDPTSPFTGGAILGDRIRMRDLAGDSGVFIRSMASRGNLGGLARATADVTRLLDAAGFDVILIETVGVGQTEVDITRHAHTVLVVEAPGFGDEVQALKAGILEIADVIVVNKSDDPRAGHVARALRAVLELGSSVPTMVQHHGRLMTIALPPEEESEHGDGSRRWQVPIVQTNALSGEGIPDLLAAVESHQAYLQESGELARRERLRVLAELDRLLCDALTARLLSRVDRAQVEALVARVAAREMEPHAAVARLIEQEESASL